MFLNNCLLNTRPIPHCWRGASRLSVGHYQLNASLVVRWRRRCRQFVCIVAYVSRRSSRLYVSCRSKAPLCYTSTTRYISSSWNETFRYIELDSKPVDGVRYRFQTSARVVRPFIHRRIWQNFSGFPTFSNQSRFKVNAVFINRHNSTNCLKLYKHRADIRHVQYFQRS